MLQGSTLLFAKQNNGGLNFQLYFCNNHGMSRTYKFRNQSKLYFVSFATVYWIDIFTRRIYKDILVDSLRYCQKNKDLEVRTVAELSSVFYFE